MGFDDIFENKHVHNGNYRQRRYHDDIRYESDSYHSYPDYRDHTKWIRIIKKIWSKRILKVLVILAGTLLLIIAIVLIIILLPVITKLFNYILQNGLQGLFNSIVDFLDKIWKGTAK